MKITVDHVARAARAGWVEEFRVLWPEGCELDEDLAWWLLDHLVCFHPLVRDLRPERFQRFRDAVTEAGIAWYEARRTAMDIWRAAMDGPRYAWAQPGASDEVNRAYYETLVRENARCDAAEAAASRAFDQARVAALLEAFAS